MQETHTKIPMITSHYTGVIYCQSIVIGIDNGYHKYC